MKQKFLYWILEAAVVLVILVALFIYMFPKFLAAQNINTPENFPDPIFRQVVESYMGVEPDGRFSRMDAKDKTEKLDVTDRIVQLKIQKRIPSGKSPYFNRVKDLKGIQYFRNISELHCPAQNIKELDLSQNPCLEVLDIVGTPVQNLNISKNTRLKHLRVGMTRIKELDISHLSNLETLGCGGCWLGTIDTFGNPQLKKLFCDSNLLTQLDLSYNPNIEELSCDDNHIKQLDLSVLPQLKVLSCQKNFLTSIDVSNNKQLLNLDCRSNLLKSIDLSQNRLLTQLDLTDNFFSDIPDITFQSKLVALGLERNRLDCHDLLSLQKIESRLFPYPRTTMISKNRLIRGFFYLRQREIDLSYCQYSK